MKKLFLLAFSALTIMGCSESSSLAGGDVEASKTDSVNKKDGVNVLSKAIVSDPENDPYSVENMSKAMRRQVLAKSASIDSQEVEQMSLEPNFLYVRFLAEGKKGAAELKAYDTSLVLFKHPLDYKPIPKPVIYIDPSLPDSIIPLFATVPVDYKFGPTKYEVLKKLFLVEPLDGDCDDEEDCSDDADSTTTVNYLAKSAAKKSSGTVLKKLSNMGVSLRDIEWESLSMTGNLNDRFASQTLKAGDSPILGWSLFGGGKKLGGQLKFKDDQLGDQPLVGVRVTGGYSYYWREAHTDKDGKFRLPEKWTFKIDFEANFDSQEFLLEDGHSSYGEDLEIEHNNYKSDWNETFTGDKAKWCAVWTAAYQYWYGERYGLKKPRTNTASNMSLDIEVYYKDNSDFKNEAKNAGINYNDGVYGVYVIDSDDRILIRAYNRPSNGLYRTTIHEIAHFSLSVNQKSSIFNSEKENYRDTYTRGIEWYFTNRRYCSSDKNAVCGISYSKGYIGLIQDLIDNNGTYAKGSGSDKVSGFKITDVENAFLASKNLDEVKSYILKNLPSGKDGRSYTEKDLNALFDYWKGWL